MILKDELPRSVDAQYATGEEWRNKPRKNKETEPKRKQHPVVDVTNDGSKDQCWIPLHFEKRRGTFLGFSRQRRIWNQLPSISLIPFLCFQMTSLFLFQRLWTPPILLIFPTLSSQEMPSPPPSQRKQQPTGENSFRILPLIQNWSVPTLWSSCHNAIEV